MYLRQIETISKNKFSTKKRKYFFWLFLFVLVIIFSFFYVEWISNPKDVVKKEDIQVMTPPVQEQEPIVIKEPKEKFIPHNFSMETLKNKGCVKGITVAGETKYAPIIVEAPTIQKVVVKLEKYPVLEYMKELKIRVFDSLDDSILVPAITEWVKEEMLKDRSAIPEKIKLDIYKKVPVEEAAKVVAEIMKNE